MTNFKAAINEAKEWKLDAFVKNNQLVVKKRGGTQVVARIEADGTISYQASGYSNSITDIAAKVISAPVATATTETKATTGKMNYAEAYHQKGFDVAEEGDY